MGKNNTTNVAGGVLLVGGSLTMSGGTIHGADAGTAANTPSALRVFTGTATYGPSGTGTSFDATETGTIEIVGGVRQ